MFNGWTDKKRRRICKLLVNNPKRIFLLLFVDTFNIPKIVDKIFEMLNVIADKIGEKNRVQIITNNAINSKTTK